MTTTARLATVVGTGVGRWEHFAGDGLMIFFNDPVAMFNHEIQAARMAVAIRDRMETLSSGWRKRGIELAVGIGLASGHATLGRIGFEGRFDYAAIGTVTILASRLSAAAKAGEILINQRLYAAAEQSVRAVPTEPLYTEGVRPARQRVEHRRRRRLRAAPQSSARAYVERFLGKVLRIHSVTSDAQEADQGFGVNALSRRSLKKPTLARGFLQLSGRRTRVAQGFGKRRGFSGCLRAGIACAGKAPGKKRAR